MSPFDESQYRRDEFDAGRPGARGAAGTAGYDEFMPEGTRPSRTSRGRTPEMFSRARDRVQRGISGATDYVRTHDVEDVLDDARSIARRNPRVAIVALVAVGFLIGRMLRRPR